MSHRMLNPGQRQILLKLKNVPFDFLDLPVLSLGKVPEKQVNFYVVVGELGRYLLADEGIRKRSDLQAPIDPVVIGKGYIAHPLFFQPSVQGLRIGVAIRKLEAAENPFRGTIAKLRMNMEIDFRGHVISRESSPAR